MAIVGTVSALRAPWPKEACWLLRPLSSGRCPRYLHSETYTRTQPDKSPASSPKPLPTPAAQRSATSLFKPSVPSLSSDASSVPLDSGFGPNPPLSLLPFSTLIRTLCITSVSSSPIFLTPAIKILSLIADSKSNFLNPDRNPVLNHILRKTIYAQFCAGETTLEVEQCVQTLKDRGLAGVILGFAKEGRMNETETKAVTSKVSTTEEAEELIMSQEVNSWKKGNLDTIDLAGEGSFVAVKFTGAGEQAIKHLLRGIPPSPELYEAMVEVCERAKARNVRLLIDAEQQAFQPTIDSWAMDLQRMYNGLSDGMNNERALVYNTYQTYLRSTPENLSKHMSIAHAEGFVLGVKLVRGAYLRSDARTLFWSHKEETDDVYDALAESLIKREYNHLLKPAQSSKDPSAAGKAQHLFPELDLILASHNRRSVQKSQDIRNQQTRDGQTQIGLSYGQIYGMADDITCELIQLGRIARPGEEVDTSMLVKPSVYKSLIWGSVGECMKYLVRRGEENKDAASRTSDTKMAMVKEIKRRVFRE
ncbi:proline dehydrogenase [Myotisia sp. PD_48]|nr:proline dehydrogenase [Myotisia sp. PD_48]